MKVFCEYRAIRYSTKRAVASKAGRSDPSDHLAPGSAAL